MRTIIITAGHSNTDPGAVGNGATEAAVVTEFRNLLAASLRARGVEPITDGQGAVNLPLRDAIRLITPGAVAVEFHCNAGPASATGVETLSQDRHMALGRALTGAVSAVLGIRDRGAKPEGSGQHQRLGFVQAGGIILELFFISNADDLARYQESKEALADRIADVLIAAAA
ncbi:N-acetylmuramoyl-L-alanine amidase LytC precursor [Bordetella ansorpii]|uniref:N-acetylmuramoyl-L-alanine amidase n=1 Tax=Bordetella ansorpii TaxID=288768 RepID=A0A157RN88_9BORD|nr:N-acetylmuramoyl-L-alanine amidase [Bordetella ansorpii]SAI58889.1 N-acetylmuramoyl-L-alanine amidase LytC precursor [Bordetella ansorpii]